VLVDVNEHRNVPALVGEGAELAAEQARQTASHSSIADQEMADNNSNNSYTTMVVVDGIVISPPVCSLSLNQFCITVHYLALCL
jgi:hypothetical protein